LRYALARLRKRRSGQTTPCVKSIDGAAMFGVISVACVLGALCWIGCSFYTRLWNKRFRGAAKHHLLCAAAAVLTAVFTVNFRAVGNLEAIVDTTIDTWYEQLNEDEDFHAETYAVAFESLKEAYPSAFKGVPEPGSPLSVIPFANDEMMRQCVSIYVEETCGDFSTGHPFLNRMLRARPGVSEDEMEADIRDFFGDNPGKRYPLARGVEIAADHIRESLIEQSPETVGKTRTILALLFFAVQLIPFGTIGYCAYKDLKIGTHDYSNAMPTTPQDTYEF
jgi:hypothetical protein